MGEISANHHHNRRPPPPPPATRSSRLAVRGGIGEIVEVEGGHIVRSTGRKDRHSKVCTAKGPRDRRVRLSAHTAIQFYDVQDRLGYDRPSKAVDWLIKNAKSAIDELAKLPAWNPNIPADPNPQEEQQPENEIPIMERFHEIEVEIENPNRGRLDFLPPNFNTDIIADSIKSFFPIGVSETNSPPHPPSSIQFQNYSPPDLVSRRNSTSSSSSFCQNNNNEDLRLSLQSLQGPILLHQPQNEELFPATTSVGFHGASFPDEHDRFHRMIAWNGGNATNTGNNNCHVSGGGGGGGFIFNSPSPSPMPMFGHGQCFSSQRGPLQSSNTTPLIRAWIDSSITAVAPDHQYLPPSFHNQSFIYGGGGGGFDSGVFSGFRIPARIQGGEEYDGVSDKPSSASSDSLH